MVPQALPMTTIPQLSAALQHVLTEAAEAADTQLRFTHRPDQAKFSASTLVQPLVFGCLAPPQVTFEQLPHTAARVGVQVSAQAAGVQLMSGKRSIVFTIMNQKCFTSRHLLPQLLAW